MWHDDDIFTPQNQEWGDIKNIPVGDSLFNEFVCSASIKLRVLQEAKIAITVWYTIISLYTYNTKLGLWKPVSLECLSGMHNKFSNQTYHYKHPLLDWKIAWPPLIFSNLFEMPIQLNDVCKMLVVGIIITQYYRVSQLIQCLRMGLLLDT